ncbi:unnamed protein product [Peniophora sp. CBMAI 1063]|nr:unnamed protein product [Peniophora sp. CBMAI 1063]
MPASRSMARPTIKPSYARVRTTSTQSASPRARAIVSEEDKDLVADFRNEVGYKGNVKWAPLLAQALERLLPPNKRKVRFWQYVDRYHRQDIVARIRALKVKASARVTKTRRLTRSPPTTIQPATRTPRPSTTRSARSSPASRRATGIARDVARSTPTADRASTQRMERAVWNEVRNARREAASLALQQDHNDAHASSEPTPPPSPRALSVELLGVLPKRKVIELDIKPVRPVRDERRYQVFDGVEYEVERYFKAEAAGLPGINL